MLRKRSFLFCAAFSFSETLMPFCECVRLVPKRGSLRSPVLCWGVPTYTTPHTIGRSLSSKYFDRCDLPKTAVRRNLSFLKLSLDSGGGGDVAGIATTMEEQQIEKVWRHIKKPLLRIGKSGVNVSHVNSLLELLDAHGAVKVKINSNKLGNLEDVARSIAEGAAVARPSEDDQSSPSAQILRVRFMDRTILFGRSGLETEVASGKYPPAPAPKWVSKEEYLAQKAEKENAEKKFWNKENE